MYPNLIPSIRDKMAEWISSDGPSMYIIDSAVRWKEEEKFEVELTYNKNRTSLLPTIRIILGENFSLDDMALLALDLLEELTNNTLRDYCDFCVQLDLDEVQKIITLAFNDYSIRPG